MSERKIILITGSNGFIGRNLFFKLNSKSDYEALTFSRSDSLDYLASLISRSDFIIHLAGENRPDDPEKFQSCNVDLTRNIIIRIGKYNILEKDILYKSPTNQRLIINNGKLNFIYNDDTTKTQYIKNAPYCSKS